MSRFFYGNRFLFLMRFLPTAESAAQKSIGKLRASFSCVLATNIFHLFNGKDGGSGGCECSLGKMLEFLFGQLLQIRSISWPEIKIHLDKR